MAVYTREQLSKAPLVDFVHATAQPSDIQFFLYKNQEQIDEIEITPQTIKEIDINLPTKIIGHGFTTSRTSSPWYEVIKKAYFSKGPHNIILIDWSKAGDLKFQQSAANVRPVGGFIADFILESRVPLDKIHLIGYSLGAHLVGFAGKAVFERTGKKIGRITGLDPAGPGFEKAESAIRLCEDDAEFVDVIHSDIGYFGIIRPIGHVDFYLNGGRDQPGCPSLETDNNCSHRRAVSTFIESITNETVQASEGELQDDLVIERHTDKKIIFGNAVDKSSRGIYFVKTGSTEPYLKTN